MGQEVAVQLAWELFVRADLDLGGLEVLEVPRYLRPGHHVAGQ